MLPIELEELTFSLQKLDALEKAPNWSDSTWCEQLAAAAAKMQATGEKLIQARDGQPDTDGLLTLGKKAKQTGEQYLEALKHGPGNSMWINSSLNAMISRDWVKLLAKGLIFQAEVEQLARVDHTLN